MPFGLKSRTFSFSAMAVVVCIVAIPMAGCTEGYPHNVAPVLSVESMSQQQRIAALNATGKLHYLEDRWRYKLNQQCELRVTNGAWWSKRHSDWIPLDDVRIVRVFDRSDKTHDIFLETAQDQGARATPLPLLAGANWADAIHILSLAQHIQRDCAQSA
nr:hypothetical protein [uncultured Rhodoferax sp.]